MAKTNKDEVKEETINIDLLKDELKDYVDIKIKNSFNEELERSNRRLIREKNKKIFVKNMVILVLVVIIGLLLYLLYSNKYFHKFFKDDTTKEESITKEVVSEDEPKKEEVKKPTLEELIEKHGKLLDKININENSDYIKEFFEGNMNSESKLYLAFNNLDFKKFTVEDDYNIIEANALKEEYDKLFSDKFEESTFKYDGNKVRYMNKLESFITDKVLEKDESHIERVITNVKEDGDKVVIECIEGVIKDGKLYNILTSKEIAKDSKLKNHEKDLTKVVYTFNNGKLESIN